MRWFTALAPSKEVPVLNFESNSKLISYRFTEGIDAYNGRVSRLDAIVAKPECEADVLEARFLRDALRDYEQEIDRLRRLLYGE